MIGGYCTSGDDCDCKPGECCAWVGPSPLLREREVVRRLATKMPERRLSYTVAELDALLTAVERGNPEALPTAAIQAANASTIEGDPASAPPLPEGRIVHQLRAGPLAAYAICPGSKDSVGKERVIFVVRFGDRETFRAERAAAKFFSTFVAETLEHGKGLPKPIPGEA
jgi:hypothetical protein